MDRNTIIRTFNAGRPIYFAAIDIENLFPVLTWDRDLVSEDYFVEMGKDRLGNRVFNFFQDSDLGFLYRGPYHTAPIPRYAEGLIQTAVNRQPLSFGLLAEVDWHFCQLGAHKARLYREKQKAIQVMSLQQDVEILRRENAELLQINEELKQIIELL